MRTSARLEKKSSCFEFTNSFTSPESEGQYNKAVHRGDEYGNTCPVRTGVTNNLWQVHNLWYIQSMAKSECYWAWSKSKNSDGVWKRIALPLNACYKFDWTPCLLEKCFVHKSFKLRWLTLTILTAWIDRKWIWNGPVLYFVQLISIYPKCQPFPLHHSNFSILL